MGSARAWRSRMAQFRSWSMRRGEPTSEPQAMRCDRRVQGAFPLLSMWNPFQQLDLLLRRAFALSFKRRPLKRSNLKVRPSARMTDPSGQTRQSGRHISYAPRERPNESDIEVQPFG